jgi:hypothetical protein
LNKGGRGFNLFIDRKSIRVRVTTLTVLAPTTKTVSMSIVIPR